MVILENDLKTEKEKAVLGLLYDPSDPQLSEDRKRSKILCYQYNQLSPDAKKERENLIRTLFGKTGENFLIEATFQCDYGYNIEIGENFYMNVNCVILDCAKVIFGDNVLIAPNVGFYTAGHPLDATTRASGLENALPITVGNNVWIGAHVSILPGVTIGDNTVIGAGSVVTKNIPANVLAVGNPCKVIRENINQ